MKRIFDLQKNVNEVTITLDYEDYINMMATLRNVVDLKECRIELFAKEFKDIINVIESIEPEYIWDEI